MKKYLIILLLLCCSQFSFSQQSHTDSVANATKSPKAIVQALYDVISGDAGRVRNWKLFRSLFHDNGRLIPTGLKKDSTPHSNFITAGDYEKIVGPQLEKNGFWEKETLNITEKFGNIAHIWSTYESRNKQDDAKPFMRGINSIQLWNDGKRWWIMNIMWQAETKDNPVPEKYSKQ